MEKWGYLLLCLCTYCFTLLAEPEIQIIPGYNSKHLEILASGLNFIPEEIDAAEQAYLKDKSENVAQLLELNNFCLASCLKEDISDKGMTPKKLLEKLTKCLQKCPLSLIRECMGQHCPLNRKKTNYRDLFEQEIAKKVYRSSDVTFFGPEYLYQALRILWHLKSPVKRAHLIDIAYTDTFNCLLILLKKNVISSYRRYTLNELRKKIEQSVEKKLFKLSAKKIKKILLFLAVWLQFAHWAQYKGFIGFFYPNVTAYLQANQRSDVIVGVDFTVGQYPKPVMLCDRLRKQNAQARYDFKRLYTHGLKDEGVVAQLWYDYKRDFLFNNVTVYSWTTLNTTSEKPAKKEEIKAKKR